MSRISLTALLAITLLLATSMAAARGGQEGATPHQDASSSSTCPCEAPHSYALEIGYRPTYGIVPGSSEGPGRIWPWYFEAGVVHRGVAFYGLFFRTGPNTSSDAKPWSYTEAGAAIHYRVKLGALPLVFIPDGRAGFLLARSLPGNGSLAFNRSGLNGALGLGLGWALQQWMVSVVAGASASWVLAERMGTNWRSKGEFSMAAEFGLRLSWSVPLELK
jgi:hypothetical protein